MAASNTSPTQTAAASPADPLAPEPILLDPILVERIWGTDDLAPWYAGPAPKTHIGEIWLTAETCRVESGAHTGQTLAELTASNPVRFGDPRSEGFPLLIKLLFPREKLSVQVHPNDAEAQALGMPRGKTECWYVISAEPGAQVAVGFNQPLTKDELRDAILDGSVENKLCMLSVQAGDMVFVDAGTVHAIGPGVVVLETQQYSDTTYRLWDYGRPRELHVDAGTAVARTQTAAGIVPAQPMDGYLRLAGSPYFAVDRFDLPSRGELNLDGIGKLQILIALDDGCLLCTTAGKSHPLPRAKALILPASTASCSLHGTAGARVMRIVQP